MKNRVPVATCLALTLLGCATQREYAVVGKQYPSFEAMTMETERAMKQLQEADVAIGYESDECLFLTVPPEFGQKSMASLLALESAVSHRTTNRQMAVVTMDPPMRMLPKADFDARVDEIERRLRGIGFRRVVIHLGSATGMPIYRE